MILTKLRTVFNCVFSVTGLRLEDSGKVFGKVLCRSINKRNNGSQQAHVTNVNKKNNGSVGDKFGTKFHEPRQTSKSPL